MNRSTSVVRDNPHLPAVLDRVEGKRIRVYAVEKSIAEAFKYRNTIELLICVLD